MVGKLGKQGFHYDIKELFEPITKADTDNNQKLLEHSKSTAKAIEALDGSFNHVEVLEVMNENGIIHSSLIRPIAKLLVPENNSQFRLYDDPDNDTWNDL